MVTRRTILKTAAVGAGAAAMSYYGKYAVAQTNEPIRIGVMTPLSGPAETSGLAVKAGCEIAVAQINKAGGINGRQLALEFRDDKANVAQATAAARHRSPAAAPVRRSPQAARTRHISTFLVRRTPPRADRARDAAGTLRRERRSPSRSPASAVVSPVRRASAA